MRLIHSNGLRQCENGAPKPVAHISGITYKPDGGAPPSRASAEMIFSSGLSHFMSVCTIVILTFCGVLSFMVVAKVIHYLLTASFWVIIFA